ncbi:aminoglycoside phosphotransferase family protein [Streptomyces sp. RB6PN25]|uniref:Aminoglycoside phosphotransferase family protein n=1 Tax=Streptomyces humicola TaxID=2953240 RepID=A0ABT1Q3Q7_9ACTN|nr:aminoglycoside phosphotransferase family protein [Streptomyces humicola]MCQ4084553.1 aminoglycoside phosphotransferase family protein [Streptomyces humicola]
MAPDRDIIRGHVPLEPPERLLRTVGAWEGEAGRDWLKALPGLVEEYLARWELTPERVQHPGGHISMVVLVRQADGTPAALKVGMVTSQTREEHAALAHWSGLGAVRLLRDDPAGSAMLLERLHADVSLRSLPDAKAMLEACGVLRRLWVAPAEGHPFASVADHTCRLAEHLRERREQPWAADARPLADEALAALERLTESAPAAPVLLHGDFHHGNVLAGDRMPWLAIDPKPLVGDPGFDLAWLAQDRLDTLVAMPAPQAAARRRIATLADALDVDRDRLRDWTLFRAVEAGLWSLSVGDREDGELALEFAAWL